MTMAIENLLTGSLAGGREIIITTRLRFAAGACVLSTGLLIGSAGGAIAWADTEDSGGSTAESPGAASPSSDVASVSEPAAKPVATPLRTTLHATLDGLTSTLRSLQKLSPQQQKKESAAADTDDEQGSGPITVDPSPVAVSDPDTVVSDPDAVVSAQTVAASDSNAAPQAIDPVKPVAIVVGPVTNAVATVTTVVMSVPGLLASLPTSATPVADVITSVQEMLTAVTAAVVPLLQVPNDLISLLGISAVDAGAIVGRGVTAGANPPVLATRASQWLELPPKSLVGSAASLDVIVPPPTVRDIAMTGLHSELPVSGTASPAQNVSNESGMGSFLEHAVSALLVPASVSALAAVALPGVGGLLIICAAGMRIGYRQAKALMEVRRAGLASFAGPGPLGVVRSGSLVAMRPRASRIVRRNASLPAARPAKHAA